MTVPDTPWEADMVTTPPTLQGINGRAWTIDVKACGIHKNGCDAMWLIEAPKAHPFWHSYILALARLEPIAGVPQAIIHLDGATHELVLQALAPDAPRQAVIDTGHAQVLSPVNFAAQMVEEYPGSAHQRAYQAVELMIAGRLSPDSDYVPQWIWLFGDNMIRRRSYGQ